MPEGDTIYKLAAALAPELRDHPIQNISIRHRARIELGPCRIAEVTSKGKHLYLELDDGRAVRSHLGLYGSWHRYRVQEPWQKPARQASLLVVLPERVYVCFNAKEVELRDAGSFHALDQRERLGPDLARDPLDPSAVGRRARGLCDPSGLVVDLLLDQRVASGIGNVYKSETLFLQGVSPSARIGTLSPDALERLYGTAAGLLRANLGGGPRITRTERDGRGNLWVYRRGGSACFRCGTPIRRAVMGRSPRSTYWCPKCQPDPPHGCDVRVERPE